MTQFSVEFCSENKMIVLDESESALKIGFSGDSKRPAFRRIENTLQKKNPHLTTELIPMGESDLMLAISGLEKRTFPKGIDAKEYEIATIENGAPVITVLNGLLLEAKEKNASDIHIERTKDGMCVRLRIDGVLQTVHRYESALGKALSVRIKLMANLNTLEVRKPQDGRFSITAGGRDHDIRVSIVPCVNGESIALRFLDTGGCGIALENLGFSPFVHSALKKMSERPHGLILLTGPTGCGKTTTLAALIRNCDIEKRKIISIEDPVEHRVSGVIQIQTNDAIGLGFGTLLKRILRQDPNVLMIGEIRDTETAELAARAALTGHLVFATLHTRSAREAETRLLDMGVPSYILDTVLYAVINQRLVRQTCKGCGGTGCASCYQSGYSGRIPLAEIYFHDIEKKDSSGSTLMDEALLYVSAGLTTDSEISRVLGGDAQ